VPPRPALPCPLETASACAAAAPLAVLPRECKCTDSPSILLACSTRKCAIHCFALLCWFRARRQKERRSGQSFPCIQPAHTTHNRTAPWLMALPQEQGIQCMCPWMCESTRQANQLHDPLSDSSSLSMTWILPLITHPARLADTVDMHAWCCVTQ
jgi:hypothetical protein